MQRKAKIVTATAKALTDPHPQFVSLVQTGANMTPFLAVKSAKTVAAKADSHDVAKIAFRSEKFADEAAVKAWLDDGGYEGYTIIKSDEGFTVAGTYDGDDLREVKMDGLSIFVAPRAAETTKTVESPVESAPSNIVSVQPVARKDAEPSPAGAEMRVKFDSWYAKYADQDIKTMDGLLAWCNDGLPPGLYEVTEVAYAAMRNCALDRDFAGMRAVGAEWGDLVARMAEMFPLPAQKSATDTDAMALVIKAFAPDLAPAPLQETTNMTTKAAASAAGADGAPAVKSDTAPAADATTPAAKAEGTEGTEGAEGGEPQPGAPSAPVTDAPAPPVENGNDTQPAGQGEGTGKAADPTMTDVFALVGKLTSTVDVLATTVATMRSEAAANEEKLAQRVSAIEEVRQTRKGADADEATGTAPGQKTTKDSDHIASLRTSGMLGLRTPLKSAQR